MVGREQFPRAMSEAGSQNPTVFSFLDSLPAKQLDALLKNEWAAVAVLHNLSSVAKL